jgi:hypothetical protein
VGDRVAGVPLQAVAGGLMLRFHCANLVFFCSAQLSLWLLNGCAGYGNALKGWRLKCEWWREVRLRQVRDMSPL